MLSISFLDATQHPTQQHTHSSAPTTQSGELSVTAVDDSLLPLNLSHFPTVEGVHIHVYTSIYMCIHVRTFVYTHCHTNYTEGLSHFRDVVSTLLQHYISVSAEVHVHCTWMQCTCVCYFMTSGWYIIHVHVHASMYIHVHVHKEYCL